MSRHVIRLTVIATASACALFLGATPNGSSLASTARSSSCGPAKGKTLVADQGGRVYTLPKLVKVRTPTYGCLFSTGRSWQLEPLHGLRFLVSKTLALHSPWVAFEESAPEGGGSVVVWSLRSGRVRRSYPAVSEGKLSVAPSTWITQIAVKGDGSVAWIGQETSPISNPSLVLREVEIGDSTGYSVVDQSAGIDPRSLRLRNSTLTWTDSDVRRSAILH